MRKFFKPLVRLDINLPTAYFFIFFNLFFLGGGGYSNDEIQLANVLAQLAYVLAQLAY